MSIVLCVFEWPILCEVMELLLQVQWVPVDCSFDLLPMLAEIPLKEGGMSAAAFFFFFLSEMTTSLGPARMSPEAFSHFLSILLLNLLNLSPSISNWIFFCFMFLFLRKYCLSYPSMAPVANISLNPYIQMKFSGRI